MSESTFDWELHERLKKEYFERGGKITSYPPQQCGKFDERYLNTETTKDDLAIEEHSNYEELEPLDSGDDRFVEVRFDS